MVSIAICDDMVQTRNEIAAIIHEKWNNLHTLFYFGDGRELVDHLEEGKKPIDIILLDVYMEGMNGIKAAQKVRAVDRNAVIIFLTASRDHMPYGYDVHALQYLLKPIDKDKLVCTLDEAIDMTTREDGWITIKNGWNYYKFSLADITHVTVENDNLLFHSLTHEPYKTRGTIKDGLDILQTHDFLQISAGCLVNPGHITNMDSLGKLITLTSKLTLTVPRRMMAQVATSFFTRQRGNTL
jgi:DNA-binding LytR/AlgR family response regulator